MTSRSPVFRSLLRLLSVSFIISCSLACLAPGTAVAESGRRSTPERLNLVTQSYWVRPGGAFTARLTPSGPLSLSQLRVQVSVFPRLHSRTALNEAIRGQGLSGAPLTSSSVLDASSLRVPGRSQVFGLRVDLIPLGARRASLPAAQAYLSFSGSCPDACDGVYPLVVDAYNAVNGVRVAQLTTFLLYVSPATTPLRLSWILPFAATLSPGSGGTPTLSGQSSTSLASLAHLLPAISAGTAPVLDPQPATLLALKDAAHSEADSVTLDELQAWAKAPGHEVMGGMFAPADPSLLAKEGFGKDVSGQTSLGESTVSEILHVQPTTSDWLSQQPLSPSALSYLPSKVTKLVVSMKNLVSVPAILTTDTTFALASKNRRLTGAVTDSGLAEQLPGGGGDPALATARMMAQLAQIYFESPSSSRGVILSIPTSWKPSSTFLRDFHAGLVSSPCVRVTSINAFFRQVPKSPIRRERDRRLAKSPKASVRANAALRSARSNFFGLSSAIIKPRDALTPLRELLYLAEAEPKGGGSSPGYLTDLRTSLSEATGRLSLGGEHSVTLTSRRAELPLTVSSTSTWTMKVIVRLRSDKLRFPDGSTQVVRISPGNNALHYLVQARTIGDSPLQVELLSPNTRMVMLSSRLTVRSTAVSAAAIGLTAAAVIFLLAWWGRSLVKGRRNRNRRLVASTT